MILSTSGIINIIYRPIIFLLWKLWIGRCRCLPTIASDLKDERSSDGDIVVFLAEWTWIWKISKQNGSDSDVLAPVVFYVLFPVWLNDFDDPLSRRAQLRILKRVMVIGCVGSTKAVEKDELIWWTMSLGGMRRITTTPYSSLEFRQQ